MKNNLIKNYYKDKKDRCFILGTGLSLNDIDLSKLENEITIGVNQITLATIPNYIVVGDNECLLLNENIIVNEKTKDCGFVFVENGSGIELPKRFYEQEKRRILKSVEEVPYFIDDLFLTSSNTGGSVVQDIAIPFSCWLGFKTIYLLGCDGGFRHFFSPDTPEPKVQGLENKYGKFRPRQDWEGVTNELSKRGVEIYTCSPVNRFKELEYKSFEEVINEKDNKSKDR